MVWALLAAKALAMLRHMDNSELPGLLAKLANVPRHLDANDRKPGSDDR